MKILHVGNVAMNAYNNAKFLRRRGIEADVLVCDYTHIMGQPEWEDAFFDEQMIDGPWNSCWEKINLHGFQRPEWFIEYSSGLPQETKFPSNLYWLIKNYLWSILHLREGFHIKKTIDKYSKSSISLEEKKGHMISSSIKMFGSYLKAIKCFQKNYFHICFLKSLIGKYDIIQAYGLEPINVFLTNTKKPLVSFEHGTMRNIPLENSVKGHLLAIAYHGSKKCIITNPDGKITADKIGLKNYVFIPHPVDTEKFIPRQTPLRKKIIDGTGAELIFFAPARHDWGIKGTNKIIEGFFKYLKRSPKRTILIFSDWGEGVKRSKDYIKNLGIEEFVIWTSPLPKIKLAEYYNASDLVLDQFSLGVFGTTPPEAMACAKPVITRFDWEINKWAWPEKPPIISAESSQEIFEAMKLLGRDENLRQELGKRGRIWMEKYHSWELVADKQIAIYKEILNEK